MDISLRALYTLAYVDLIACEDTRVSKKLLSLYDIHTPLTPYHDHNGESQRPKLLQRLQEGQTIALMSDAGTPLISDPGYKLVQACQDADLPVTAIPGPSAPLTALTLSGLSPVPFTFAGFIPPKPGARQTFLMEWKDVVSTLVFFETSPRLEASLHDLHRIYGDRQAVVARELTKKFEEIKKGPLSTLCDHYTRNGPPKGELVLVVEGVKPIDALTDDDIQDHLRRALKQSPSLKDAVTHVAEAYHLSRRRVYKLALELTP